MSRRRHAFAAGLLLLAACGSRETPTPPAPPKLEVWGDMGSNRETVYVQQDGVRVDDADVQVDGQQLYSVCVGCGSYEGALNPERVAGETLSLVVTRGSSRVTGSGTLPESPVLTSPADGGIFSWAEPIAVAWTSASDPDRFEVEARWRCNTVSSTGAFDASGTARALTIPAGSFVLCSGPFSVAISVRAVDTGSLTGDYATYTGDRHAGMNVGASSSAATLRK